MKVKEKIKAFGESRLLILQIILVIISIVFICRLFYLQIINGEEYRKESESRLLRTTKVEAPRGEITDRNGVVLATNRLGYDIVMYETAIKNEELNQILLNITNILEKNNDKYISNLPFDSNGEFQFYSEEDKEEFFTLYELEKNISSEAAINNLCDEYAISADNYTLAEILKILNFRYEIEINGYSYSTCVILAKDVSYDSMVCIEEMKSELNRSLCFIFNQKGI